MKTMFFRRFGNLSILTLAMVVFSIFSGCGTESSALLGRWEREEASARLGFQYMELFKDGTGVGRHSPTEVVPIT